MYNQQQKIYQSYHLLFHFPGWRCGSVVRTSVCGWQTFPDLCT